MVEQKYPEGWIVVDHIIPGQTVEKVTISARSIPSASSGLFQSHYFSFQSVLQVILTHFLRCILPFSGIFLSL
jgi:hypothetical protein